MPSCLASTLSSARPAGASPATPLFTFRMAAATRAAADTTTVATAASSASSTFAPKQTGERISCPFVKPSFRSFGSSWLHQPRGGATRCRATARPAAYSARGAPGRVLDRARGARPGGGSGAPDSRVFRSLRPPLSVQEYASCEKPPLLPAPRPSEISSCLCKLLSNVSVCCCHFI